MTRYPSLLAAGPLALLLVLGPTAGVAGAEPDRATGRPGDYLAYGDSLTAGVGTSDWTYPDEGEGEPVRVGHSHGYAELAGVRASGVGGACLAAWCGPERDSLARLAPVLDSFGRRPRVVVALVGLNDLVAGRTAKQVTRGLRHLRREARYLGVRLVLGTITPPPAGDPVWGQIQERRLEVNAWIRAHGPHVDYAAALEGDDGFLRRRFMGAMADVHVGDRGARAMARVLTRFLAADRGASA